MVCCLDDGYFQDQRSWDSAREMLPNRVARRQLVLSSAAKLPTLNCVPCVPQSRSIHFGKGSIINNAAGGREGDLADVDYVFADAITSGVVPRNGTLAMALLSPEPKCRVVKCLIRPRELRTAWLRLSRVQYASQLKSRYNTASRIQSIRE